MKTFFFLTLALVLVLALHPAFLLAQEAALDPERVANSIPLDETAVKNLRIETVVAEEQDFETTVFAIGRIEEIPSKHSVLSSRIPGRIVSIEAFVGDHVKAGQVLARVESRQQGNPPPTIELTAPQAGLIISSHVRLGEPVEPSNELLDISDRSTMWAVAKVPENDASQIKPGSKARIKIPALGGDPILATMLRYGVNADRQSGTIEAIFELENANQLLQPGMRVEFSLITSTRSDVLAVPRTAVQGSSTKRVVFVKDFELPNVFIRSPVVLGEENEEFVEIISGIFPADEVVTRGSYSLGFAGSGSGMSLKEVLDAAHGHEHAEDGSELTPEQIAEKKAAADPHGQDHEGNSNLLLYLQIYAGLIPLLFIGSAQLVWRRRKATA